MSTVDVNQDLQQPRREGLSVSSARDWIAGASPAAWAVFALITGAFAGLFFRWLWKQHRLSSAHVEDWGHAYLIPLISGYMIWLSKDRIAKFQPVVFWPGLAPLLLGVISYLNCIVFISNHMLQGLSLILTLFGVALTLLGPWVMRTLFLPIAFLVFAITISEAIMLRITFPLQLLAADGAFLMLSVIGWASKLFSDGFSVEVDGNILTVITASGELLPMNVAEACSGMRMVIAFIALGGMVALLGTQAWWQRIGVLLISAPVALLMNVVRVGVLGLASLVDPDLAVGDAHTLIGTILLIPALGLFMTAIWVMNRIVQDEPETESKAGGSK